MSGLDTGYSHNSSGSSSRKRSSKACDVCHKKKVRCDGEQPCRNCQKSGSSCLYTPSNRKRGPRTGYIESLEEKVNEMQRLLAMNGITDVKSSVDCSDSDDDDDGSDDDDTSRGGGQSTTNDTLLRDTGRRRPTKRVETGLKVHKPTSLAAQQLRKTPRSTPLPDLDQRVRSLTQPASIARVEIDMEKIEIFFSFVHPILPVIHRDTFFNKLMPVNRHPPALLYAMYASVGRKLSIMKPSSTSENPVGKENGEEYFNAARKLLGDYIHEPKLSSVQALVLLTSYAGSAGQLSLAQILQGMAVRMAQQLRLNHDVEEFPEGMNMDWRERETRRRTWWVLYLLVSSLCLLSGLGR
jgi:hypothetical protein